MLALLCSCFITHTTQIENKHYNPIIGGGPLTRRMNAIKVHSGHNNTNSINFRGAGPGGGFRDSIRAATGTGLASDLVYPPDINHKIGNLLPLSMLFWECSLIEIVLVFLNEK